MAEHPRVEADPNNPGAWMVRLGHADHSYVDPDRPDLLLFDYVQRIADAVDAFAPEGQRIRVVHIGGAGMTLPRYVATTRPTSAQIVLEPDVELIEEVRATIPLPRHSGIKVRPIDGRAGIAAMPDDYADVVIVDAFSGTQVPAELTTVGFFGDLRRVLRPDGMAIVNLTDHRDLRYTRRVLAGARMLWRHVLLSAEPGTLKGKRFGNLLVFASATGLPEQTLQRKAASAAFPYRIVAGKHLDRFVGHAAPFSDAAPEPSPEPPNGSTSWF
ncbi:spermidine synthase [Enemella sp. A6]|uniref:spermidine synthase n=1 Tax=Enemella sp. A6 TaxID=3440152 RepID=UPI003EB7C3FD